MHYHNDAVYFNIYDRTLTAHPAPISFSILRWSGRREEVAKKAKKDVRGICGARNGVERALRRNTTQSERTIQV